MENKINGKSAVLFHKILWYFNVGDANQTQELYDKLKEEAESKCRQDIISGCMSGELCFSGLVKDQEVEYFGWWMFEE